eukprot:CAMPEP_0117543688 /NCGR_PEP_ID=MMETSP0784-20121206/45188_1 /TAXON_ID=39447 /ORGANISM="" /LENGTH=307 /DNA_ID=CAMNT_0005340471 /DNA_START=1 /DNA_END=924 /DNA_ORIENTATION=+
MSGLAAAAARHGALLARRRTCSNAVMKAAGAIQLAGRAVHTHALELDGAGAATWRQLTVLPVLTGRVDGPAGGLAAAEAVRKATPRQVLVELCASRYAEALGSALLGLPTGPPPRLDILGNIHGGLLMHELVPVLLAAREVGAAVVPIDRPRSATRSRVAQRLWHPRLIQGLLRYGGHSLCQRETMVLPGDAYALDRELERHCPAAHEVLVDERCRYMAHQVRAAAAPGADVVLVCGALHYASVAEALRRSPPKDFDFIGLARRTVPVWPLYVATYVIIPGALACYVVVGAWMSFVAPALADDGSGL